MAQIDIKVPDIGDFKDVVDHRGAGQARRHGQGRAVADHGRERQGVDGDPVVARRRRQGAEGQGRRQGQRRLGDPDARDARRGGAARRGGRAAPARRRRRPRSRRAAPAAPAPRRRHAAPTPSRRRRAPRRRRAGTGRAASAPRASGPVDVECDLLVLGAGPGGYSAAFRAADLGLKTVLVERYATLGGVCLNVGCIPSKALLHVAAVMDEVKHFARHGRQLRRARRRPRQAARHKDKVVGKLTGGLAAMAKMRKVTVVQGQRRVPRPAPPRGRARAAAARADDPLQRRRSSPPAPRR